VIKVVKCTIVTFYNDDKEVLGRFKSMESVPDKKIESLLKEHDASHATIEYQARLVRELNIKIA